MSAVACHFILTVSQHRMEEEAKRQYRHCERHNLGNCYSVHESVIHVFHKTDTWADMFNCPIVLLRILDQGCQT